MKIYIWNLVGGKYKTSLESDHKWFDQHPVHPHENFSVSLKTSLSLLTCLITLIIFVVLNNQMTKNFTLRTRTFQLPSKPHFHFYFSESIKPISLPPQDFHFSKFIDYNQNYCFWLSITNTPSPLRTRASLSPWKTSSLTFYENVAAQRSNYSEMLFSLRPNLLELLWHVIFVQMKLLNLRNALMCNF